MTEQEIKGWDFEVGLQHGVEKQGVLSVWMSKHEAARVITSIGLQLQMQGKERICLTFCGQLEEDTE